jgi:hypothetical protein
MDYRLYLIEQANQLNTFTSGENDIDGFDAYTVYISYIY